MWGGARAPLEPKQALGARRGVSLLVPGNLVLEDVINIVEVPLPGALEARVEAVDVAAHVDANHRESRAQLVCRVDVEGEAGKESDGRSSRRRH